jgi:hypothetical protein
MYEASKFPNEMGHRATGVWLGKRPKQRASQYPELLGYWHIAAIPFCRVLQTLEAAPHLR